MAEQINLTTPVTKPNTTTYFVQRLVLDWDSSSITVYLRGDDNSALSKIYDATTAPTGLSLLIGLNKADLSTAYAGNATTGSLNQRIFHRLKTDGVILGTIAGTVP